MKRAALLRGVAVTAGAGAALAVRTTAVAQQVGHVNVGLTARGSDGWIIFIAEKTGLFTAAGLQTERYITGSAAACAQQLAAGALDVGSLSTTQMVEGINGGAGFVAIINNIVTAPYVVLARKGTTSFAQLRGKTIIVGGVNDVTRVFVDRIAQANGFKPDDITYTYAGASTERYAALVSGAVDAAILLPPLAFRAADEGYVNVGEVQKYFPNLPFTALAGRTAWLQSRRDDAVAFVKSYLQGVRWLNDPANKARAIAILIEETGVKPEDAAKTYDLYVTRLHIYSTTGRFTTNDFAHVIDVLVKTKEIVPPTPSPSRYFDNRYADAALAQMRRR